jgi:hypothetical protein
MPGLTIWENRATMAVREKVKRSAARYGFSASADRQPSKGRVSVLNEIVGPGLTTTLSLPAGHRRESLKRDPKFS